MYHDEILFSYFMPLGRVQRCVSLGFLSHTSASDASPEGGRANDPSLEGTFAGIKERGNYFCHKEINTKHEVLEISSDTRRQRTDGETFCEDACWPAIRGTNTPLPHDD